MNRRLFLSFRLKEFIFGFAAVVLCVFCVCMFDFNTLLHASGSAIENKSVVIIDPGHGEFDGGTQSMDGVIEKDVNLQIALKLRAALDFMGYSTVMTRETDRAVSDESASTIRQKKSTDLNNRLKITEKYPDGLFLSIHQNYFSQSRYNGTQVFYSKNNPESKRLAEILQKCITQKLQPENKRQIKPSGSEIFLLHKAQLPAVMVECGFLSNADDTRKLTDNEYQKKLVLSICEGIKTYFETDGE